MEARKNKYFVPASLAASDGFYVWPMRYEGKCTGKLLGEPVLS